MDVLKLNEHNLAEWDKFVWECSDTSHFHLGGWKAVLESAFGLKPYYLFAKDGDHIRGILPLIPVSSRLTGRYVTSMPGGLCAADEETAELLIQAAIEFVKRVQANYLILRDSYHKWDLPGLMTNDNHCTMLVELHEDPEKIWYAVNRRTRQSVKKAFHADLEVICDQNSLDVFYPIYSRALQERGTPTQGSLFFESMLREFPSVFNILVVYRDNQILGGGFVAFFKDTIYNTWGGMPRQYYDLHTNYILYWETLKYGCENGYKWVDLGRSEKNSGVLNFKKQWRGKPKPLYQQYYLNGISDPPAVGNQRADDIQYRLFSGVWKHLPLPLTEILGAQIRKRMPFG